jgi:UDP-N-acetylmuramoyl-tripeptide--D-alanyl-D-alanine ligase
LKSNFTIKDFLNVKCSKYKGVNIEKQKFTGVAIDSRTVKKDEVFIAIQGENTDGHLYLSDVFKRGCKLAVVSWASYTGLREKFKNKNFIIVKDTTKYLGQLAQKHLENNRVPVLCVAGSNGKTTTKDLIAEVLSKRYNILKTEGNLNNHIGLPLTLLRLNKSHNFCVLEIGSNHFGELKYLCEICKPDFGLVTNIGKEHLEFFINLKGVAKAEFELYDYLKKNKGMCFLNLDDKFISSYSKKVKKENKFTYSFNYKTDVKGNFIEFNKKFQPVINVKFKDKEFSTSVNTFGLHSIFNGLAAVSTGLYFDIKISDIKNALQNFTSSSSKRMEVEVRKGITIVNDAYNSNPDSVKLGLETIKKFKTNGEKYIVLGDMLELGKSSKKEHSGIGRLASEMKFENLYTYGPESYNTYKSAKNVKNNFYFTEKQILGDLLKHDLKKDDIVYVKGSRGMKMEDVIKIITS